MSERRLYELSRHLDEAINASDYTPSEMQQLLNSKVTKTQKEKYFEFYDDIKDRTLQKQDW